MTLLHMNDRALNRALLARQFLLQRAPRTPFAVIEHLLGLQSQAPHPPYAGLWSRVEGFDPNAVSNGLRDRSLVRVSSMRGTIHLMSARNARAIRPWLQPTYDRLLRANAAFPKLDGLDLPELVAFGRQELTARPRSLAELRPALLERWPDRDPAALALAISDLVPIVQLPPRGLWRAAGKPVLMPLEAWIGDEETAAAELDDVVLRYLAAFGPANAADMQTWSGLMGLHDAFARVRSQLITVMDGKRELVDLPDAPRPDPDSPAPVRFIAEWDNLLIGHQRRTRIMSEENRKRIATPNGMVPGTVLIDGFMNGTWKVIEGKGSAELVITPFLPITPGIRNELEEEGLRLLTFLTPDATANRDVSFHSL
jgi:hypothetical protein